MTFAVERVLRDMSSPTMRWSYAASVLCAAIALSSCARASTAHTIESAISHPPVVKSVAPIALAETPPPDPPPTMAPLRVEPPLPPFEMGMMDHRAPVGWSRDAAWLGGCGPLGGTGGRICTFSSPNGKHFAIDDFDPKTGPVAARTKALESRVKTMELGAARATWRFADVIVTWMTIEGDQTATPPVRGRFRIGARVTNEPTVWIETMSAGAYHDRLHPEIIALSPDGEWIGVIAHAFAGEFSDAFPTTILSSREVAAKAYDAAADFHQKRGDVAGERAFRDRARRARTL